ncbi:MAG: M1 family metallopeptidase, partial [Melioribacteraceae bacterium]
MPESSLELKIEWSFIIPSVSPVRMGAYDSTSFFVALWYPQIAVYDDIAGWSMYNYTGQQEFYNDANDYEVDITMPREYIVWATGILTNAEEVLNEEYFEKYNDAHETEDVINIITKKDREKKQITKNETNTWKFKARYVPDFAFAVSNTYLWDLTSVEVDKSTGRRVLTGAAYNEKAEDFYEVAAITRDAVKLLSEDLPGIPYPYPTAVIFNGGGNGMEFPMLINNPEKSSRSQTVGVAVHELVHQYFPFYTGVNEIKYAWMEEGWARMLQFDIQKKIEPSSNRRIETVLDYSNISG